ncbi:MAG: NAD-dependent epimerase/dehydratase family protein [Candidatus Omnitrophica bacterium]|nr:NAD-dependent epimerase/dehydratase family protein [Candidatus Omnitrophota bacterium]
MNSKEIFSEFHCALKSGEDCVYYVYPQNQKKFDRVLVYLHGLVSDIHWFEIPKNIPKGTAVLFLPRHPRIHVKSFEEWTDNFEECFQDFKRRHESHYYHLVGHCFGALPGLHWAAMKPLNFTSLTLVSPPFELKDNFDIKTKIAILFGKKEQLHRSLLTPRHFTRLPYLRRFIENNPTTTFHFSNSFFLETEKLRKWLVKNVIYYPVPTHFLLSSEDAIVKPGKLSPNGQVHDLPEETTLIYSDHYTELLPNKNLFWNSVFDFQLRHEIKFEIHGRIHKILVTGSTGFVGSHIVRKLAAEGKEVVALVRDPEKARKIFPDIIEKIELRKGELDDAASMEKALEEIDAVIHTAAHVSDWDRKERFNAINV